MSHAKHIGLIQGTAGGILAGIALSNSGGLLMFFALSLLWPASKYPVAGSVWGGLAVLISHRWILDLHPLTWIGVPAPLSLFFTVLIWFSCALFGAVLSGGWCLLGQVSFFYEVRSKSLKNNFFYALFMSSIWGLAETILTRLPFFWVGVGNALLPSDRWLSGLARWFGAGGLVVVQFLIAWWIWQAIVAFKRRNNWQRFFLYGLVLTILLHCFGGLLLMKSKAFDQKRIALWQTAIPTREKFSFKQVERLPKALLEALNKAKEKKAFLMIAPEGTMDIGHELVNPAPLPFFSGGFRSSNGFQRSSLLLFKKDDINYSKFLDKYRLVPLGEWVPKFLGVPFQGLSSVGGLEPGDPSRAFFWEGGPPFAVAICYELSNGNSLANAIDKGAEWIVSIANLDPYPLSLQRQFISLAQLRSIETGRDLVIAANTGPTSLISSQGKVISALPPFLEDLAIVDVNFYKGRTAYIYLREFPLIVFCLFGFSYLYRFGSR